MFISKTLLLLTTLEFKFAGRQFHLYSCKAEGITNTERLEI